MTSRCFRPCARLGRRLGRRLCSSLPTPPGVRAGPKLIPDYLTPTPSHLLTTTLRDLVGAPVPPAPRIGCSPPATLPQGHHLVYFPIQTPPSGLAADGADPDHSPGGTYPRRMWAGGEVVFHPGWGDKLVLDGRPWSCDERIGEVVLRNDKVFVDVWRRYGLGHGDPGARPRWDIEERRTLVFLKSAVAPSTRLIRLPDPTFAVEVLPTRAHLFHFSALTFNAHAIHLDPLYARATDGHRDLLVHGPLTLALMLDALPPVASISYRNYAPLYVNERLRVCVRRPERPRKPWDVWVEGPDGGLAVKATAEVLS